MYNTKEVLKATGKHYFISLLYVHCDKYLRVISKEEIGPTR